MDSWKRNPDEVLARWRKRTSPAPKVELATAIIWNMTGIDEPNSACLLIRPWEGELLLSLSTMGGAPNTLLRRPWLAPEPVDEPDHE